MIFRSLVTSFDRLTLVAATMIRSAGSFRCRVRSGSPCRIKFFDADELSLTTRIRQADDKIALLPKHIHPGQKVVDDDF